MDTGATYHVHPKREWFASFENLDRGLVSLGDGHAYQIERIGTVCIKLFDGMISVTPRSRNTYSDTYSDFLIVFFRLFFVLILFYDYLYHYLVFRSRFLIS